MITLLLAFTAGLLTIVSPCVLPLAPIVIAGARARNATGPLMLALGLAVTFGVVGGVLASFSIEFGEAGFIRNIAAALMVAFGLIMLVPALGLKAEAALGPLAGFADRLGQMQGKLGLRGQFLAGVILAFAWAPCVGPTLGAAFALAASGGSLASAIITMTAFAFGAALALLLAGFGISRLAARGRLLTRLSGRIANDILAAVLIFVGGAILSGTDIVIEARLVSLMPDWLVQAATKI